MSTSRGLSNPALEPSPEAAGASSGRGAKALAGWLIAAMAVLPLLPTLRAAFMYDDTIIIRDNALLRGWPALARVWSAPYWPSSGPDVSGLYRPLHVALLAVVWNIGAGAPRPFHVYAILLYALVVVAAWRLLRSGVGEVPAALGALWFALHPLHVEAVASVVNSSEVLVTGFTIALAWVVARLARPTHRSAPREWALALTGAALTAAAILSKESGLLALPLAVVTAWGWRRPDDAVAHPFAPRRLHRLWLAGGAALGMALLARATVLGAPIARVSIAAPGLDVLSPGDRIVTMLSLWPRIAKMLVWPGALSPYYGPTIVPAHQAALATLAVLSAAALVALVALLAWRGERRPVVALAWVALTYLPASNLLTATGQIVADRTLFGASLGVALALAWAIDRVPRRVGVALVLVCVIAIARGAVESARHAVTWSSHRTLWERLVEVSPTEYLGYQMLGIDARERGDTARALPLLARAFAMDPRDRRGRFEYGQVLYATGRFEQAAQVLAPLLSGDDARAEARFVGMYLDAVGRARGADAVVRAGAPLLRSRSAVAAALFVGAAYERLGRPAAADSVYAIGLRAQPGDSALRARRASVERRLTPQ